MQELTLDEVNAVGGGDFLEDMGAVGDIAMAFGAMTGNFELVGAGAALRFTAAYFK